MKLSNYKKVELPQFVVFGSGSEDPGWGSKADPNRPITTVDFAAYEALLGLIMQGLSVPDLKGADPKKIPEIVNKARKLNISLKKRKKLKLILTALNVQHAIEKKIVHT